SITASGLARRDPSATAGRCAAFCLLFGRFPGAAGVLAAPLELRALLAGSLGGLRGAALDLRRPVALAAGGGNVDRRHQNRLVIRGVLALQPSELRRPLEARLNLLRPLLRVPLGEWSEDLRAGCPLWNNQLWI